MNTKLSTYCEKLIEAGWLIAIIVAPLFFNIYSSRVFEPDKITLIRSIALVMALAWVVKTVEGGLALELPRPAQEPPASAGITARPISGVPYPLSQAPALLIHLGRRLRANPLAVPASLLAVVYLLSTVFSVIPHVSFWGSYHRLQGTYSLLSYLVIFFLALQGLRTREQVDRLISTILLTSLPIALYGLIQKFGFDLLPWSADVTGEPKANMGNSIFLAAYLIMVVPLVLGRLLEALLDGRGTEPAGHRSGRTGRRPPRGSWVTAHKLLKIVSYTLLLAVLLTTILFAGSRGPLIGLMGGGGVFVVLAILVFGSRRLMFAALILGLILFSFVVVLNLPNSPLASVRDVPYIGMLGRLAAAGPGTSIQVRMLIWEEVAQLAQADLGRALVGYGPESLIGAGMRFYQPELAYAEQRSALPDRSHNETFDLLATSGLLGLAAFLGAVVSLLYYVLKWLGLIRNQEQRLLFLILMGAQMLLGVMVPRVLAGTFLFLAVGLPLGVITGVLMYLMIYFLFYYRPAAHLTTPDAILLTALGSAVVAHFLEINFGIAIAATRTYFWIYAALIAVIGGRLLTSATDTTAQTGAEDHAARRAGRRRAGPSLGQTVAESRHLISRSLLVAVILITLAYELVTQQFDASANHYMVVWLFGVTWLAGAGFALRIADSSPRNPKSQIRNPKSDIRNPTSEIRHPNWATLGLHFLVYSLLTLVPLLLYAPIHQNLLQDAATVTGALTFYYIALGLALLGLAAGLLVDTPLPATFWRPRRGWAYPILGIGVAALVFVTNISVVHADMHYKQGQHFDGQQWDEAIAQYRQAINSGPTEDYYYLYLGRAYMEKAKGAEDPREQTALMEQARDTFEQAISLNPLHIDHLANLARFYNTWANMTDDPELRAERVDRSLEAYRRATEVSPNQPHLYNEWANVVYHHKQDPQAALRLYEQSLQVDPKFDQTYLSLGDLLLTLSQKDEARRQEYRERAIQAYQAVTQLPPFYARDSRSTYKAWDVLGYLYAQLGETEKAIHANQQALEIDSDSFNNHKNLALLYQEQGRVDEAIAEAQKAWELAPKDEKPALETYIMQLGGDLPAEAATEAGGSDQRLVQTYLEQGQLYLEQGDQDRAAEAFRQALELNPNLPGAHSYLGLIYAQQGKVEEAIQENLAVLEFVPDDFDSHKNLALLYQQQGRMEDALQEAQTALELAPEDQKAAMRDFIEQLKQQIEE